MSLPMLSVQNVTKRFGGIVALENVCFDVMEGEIVGLMGPNGAGKTTLLNIIAGEFPPDSGKILYKGHDITGHPSHKSCHMGIARTYQIPQPFVSLTVRQNLQVSVIFGCKSGSLRSEHEVNRILDLTGLTERENTIAGELPILLLKRLELARALATDPELILMDEVAAGLTETEIPRILNTIKEIRKMGKTILLVEHVMKVMINAVDRIVVLDKGVNLCQGTPESVINDCKVIEAYFGTEEVNTG